MDIIIEVNKPIKSDWLKKVIKFFNDFDCIVTVIQQVDIATHLEISTTGEVADIKNIGG